MTPGEALRRIAGLSRAGNGTAKRGAAQDGSTGHKILDARQREAKPSQAKLGTANHSYGRRTGRAHGAGQGAENTEDRRTPGAG